MDGDIIKALLHSEAISPVPDAGTSCVLRTRGSQRLNRHSRIRAGLLLLAIGGGLLLWDRSERSLRIPLQGGGEFCAVKICYGPAEVHRLGGSPRAVFCRDDSVGRVF